MSIKTGFVIMKLTNTRSIENNSDNYEVISIKLFCRQIRTMILQRNANFEN